MKIASMVGVTGSGDMQSLGLAHGNGVSGLIDQYRAIVAADGVVQKAAKGKKEVKVSELYLLSNNTAGGELKARKRFVV